MGDRTSKRALRRMRVESKELLVEEEK